MDMSENISRVELVPSTQFKVQKFGAVREKGAYIVALNLTDLSFEFAQASKTHNPTTADVAYLNREI